VKYNTVFTKDNAIASPTFSQLLVNVMALLEAGQISSGRASRILKVSGLEILEMMGKWGISVFDDSQNLEELSQEVEQAQ
jgi:predicted HTH domain antitoxin